MPEPIHKFIVAPHAADQMRRRGIDEITLESVLSAPERRLSVRAGRELLERVVEFGGRSKPFGIPRPDLPEHPATQFLAKNFNHQIEMPAHHVDALIERRFGWERD